MIIYRIGYIPGPIVSVSVQDIVSMRISSLIFLSVIVSRILVSSYISQFSFIALSYLVDVRKKPETNNSTGCSSQQSGANATKPGITFCQQFSSQKVGWCLF